MLQNGDWSKTDTVNHFKIKKRSITGNEQPSSAMQAKRRLGTVRTVAERRHKISIPTSRSWKPCYPPRYTRLDDDALYYR